MILNQNNDEIFVLYYTNEDHEKIYSVQIMDLTMRTLALTKRFEHYSEANQYIINELTLHSECIDNNKKGNM